MPDIHDFTEVFDNLEGDLFLVDREVSPAVWETHSQSIRSLFSYQFVMKRADIYLTSAEVGTWATVPIQLISDPGPIPVYFDIEKIFVENNLSTGFTVVGSPNIEVYSDDGVTQVSYGLCPHVINSSPTEIYKLAPTVSTKLIASSAIMCKLTGGVDPSAVGTGRVRLVVYYRERIWAV
jgi:hypothetical protein